MPKKHLNDQFIRNLAASGKRAEYYDQHLVDPETNTVKRTGVKGLALRITKAGSKSFVYRYWYNGQSKRYKIGSYPNIGLSDARDEARVLSVKVNRGIDPLAEKQKRELVKDSLTFKELTDEFKIKHLPTLRDNTRYEYNRIIDNELIPTLGNCNVEEISKSQIIILLDKKAYKDDSPTMANRMRARLSRIFTFGMERAMIESNPVQNTTTYKGGNNKRDRRYTEKEIIELWGFFEQWGEPTESVLKMLLICGQRKTETMKMRWDNINDKIWTIPAELAKNKQAHDVPLPPMAIDIIEKRKAVSGKSDWVFESPQKPGEPIQWIQRVSRAIQANSTVDDFRPHDLRRTATSYMAKLGVDRTVLGKILNHKGLSRDGHVTSIYDRHDYMDEKREALKKWSSLLQRIIK